MSATAPRAASITASSCSLRGNCQARSPNTSSQPSPSSALMVSGGSSRGAKMRIFGLDMQAPWHRGLIQLDVGLLNNGGERLALLAREVCEGLPGKAGEVDCKGIEPFAYVRLLADGIQLRDQLVDNDLRHADRSDPPEPSLHLEARQRLGDGRNIRPEGVALGRGHGDCTDFPSLDLFPGG
jgi:hypothetical protein